MAYRDIDHLLLNLNKGPGAGDRSGSAAAGLPRPGDSVMVAVGDKGLLSILIHRASAGSMTLAGEAVGDIRAEDGSQIIGDAAHVRFSYQKIAGINRR